MHPLNPLLRSFFRSTLPAQCTPIHHHILLVPTTDVLYSARDRESQTYYADLVNSEDFLASHVLRVPAGSAPFGNAREGSNVRDTKGKAKQYPTLNGRTVVVKDNFVYSNKGFRSLNQAQLLGDALYYPDTFESQQWLVYYISKPLVGSYEPISHIPALTEGRPVSVASSDSSHQIASSSPLPSSLPGKKVVKSFNELLNHFPMIARQMQPGFERLFKNLNKELDAAIAGAPWRLSPMSSRRRVSRSSSRPNGVSNIDNPLNGHAVGPESPASVDEKYPMRRALESAVTAAIDLFQLVDKQQLSILGATTDLTGPMVERMIERYVLEQVHDSVLFPKLCVVFEQDDSELESRIKHMTDIDVSQVGIENEDDFRGKRELSTRIAKAVGTFRKIGVAGSPQEMLEIILATEKAVTSIDYRGAETSTSIDGPAEIANEKLAAGSTVNADILVSLLLVVVIRSTVRHLHARLAYMRQFIFIDDVESGELGYALSTFEAVLSYLSNNSGGLRRASRRNKKLWQATRAGNVRELRYMLEPSYADTGRSVVEGLGQNGNSEGAFHDGSPGEDILFQELAEINGIGFPAAFAASSPLPSYTSEGSTLAHVFPFERAMPLCLSPEPERKLKKRVSMEARSLSSSSAYSSRSHTTTIDSRTSELEPNISTEQIAMSHDASGRSILMMAVEARQEETLRYLLGLSEYFSVTTVLEDCDNEGTTLLSAAVQLGNTTIVKVILDFVLDNTESDSRIISYLARQDDRGRGVAHYLFHDPHLISSIGLMLPWRTKDKNGQTPLFALCRSYDHEEYSWMVQSALSAATQTQNDALPLHLDDHVDSRGNTLLHIVNDPHLALHLLHKCDSDVNAANDKRFTPIMVASKYGRIDMVRTFFSDPRVDLFARDIRGLTAVELAKDDDVRNRIDDLVLLSTPAGPDGRITTIVRSFFVEDGTIRMILKSGAPNNNGTVTVTTCRRSVQDFENLAKCLAMELPASWLPSAFGFRSPFLIPSRPARSILRDIQLRLDHFLRTMLMHTTFSTHEMLWEFFLVPDIDPALLVERSKKKAETRFERVKEEFDPLEDVRDVESFVGHARDMVRGMNHATKDVVRRVNALRAAHTNVFEAQSLSAAAIATLPYLPEAHIKAFTAYSKTLCQTEASALTTLYYDMQAISSTMGAILQALSRPQSIIGSMSQARKNIERNKGSLRRNDRWPLGLLDDTRNRMHQEALDKVEQHKHELASLGSELSYTQQTVASELAGWQDMHQKMGRQALRTLATKMVVSEKARLEGMKRSLREITKSSKA